ncbi:MAG TPA: type VI secretion system baseplate subunit TssE [Candidatus Acidoferrales bacterium]|nr:type VI secretion system baseplate subunit TssE [Candidatus Acidoferrales bacterium]
MASPETTGIVTLSVLDRLIDREPKNRSEAMPTSAQSLRAMKAALRRDLEWLMNTRRVIDDPPESSTELRRSAYYYGLPDISSMSILSSTDQSFLLMNIETAITFFEPRLARVKVSLRPVTGAGRAVHFVIEGLLRVDPVPEQIVFDTVLELSSGTYQIRGDAGAG